jgi:hypothetical protein
VYAEDKDVGNIKVDEVDEVDEVDANNNRSNGLTKKKTVKQSIDKEKRR